MSSHNYNKRTNSLTSIEESTSNDTIVYTPSQTNTNTPQFSETASLTINLEKKMTSRFDGLDNEFERCNYELLNLKGVIIKNLLVENERLRKKVNVLENKISTLESDQNSLEQYGCRNNIENIGIPDTVPDQNLEKKVVDILNEISVNVSPNDIEACIKKQLKEDNSLFRK